MFYGWKIVAVAWVTHFISVGFIFYSYGVFILALSGEFGSGKRTGVAMGLALMNIANGLFAPFLGRLLDRHSIRVIMCTGSIAMAVGFFLASRITGLWQFYVLMGTMLGLGASSIGGIPGSTLVANWFIKRRGTALGVATMGVSMSGIFMPPLATYLIQAIGWRNTFMAFGGVAVLVVFPLVSRFVVNRPEDLGLLPDGDTPLPQAGDPDDDEPLLPLAPGDQMIDHATHLEWSSLGLLSSLNFWVITATIGLNFFAMSAMLTHMIPHAADLGISASDAAYLLSIAAGFGVFGKVLFGYVTDFVDSRLAMWLAIGFQAAGTIVTIFSTTYWPLALSAGLFGFGMGGVLPMWGVLNGESFGRHSFGRAMGLMSPCMLPVQSAGVPFAAYIFDRQGHYDAAFYTFLGVYGLSAVIILFLRKQPVPPGAPAGSSIT